MRINTNVDAINAQRNLAMTGANFSKSVEKLSSGLRINRAGDDAAGLSISEKLRGQVRGLNQAVRNAQDGISMIQTAEGALNESQSILQRMRELTVQASNDTLTQSDREAIGNELTSLRDEVNRIADTTQFNTKILLKGGLNSTLDASSTLTQGEGLTTATGIVVGEIQVNGAQAGKTFTFSNTAVAGKLTLSDGAKSQTIDVSAMTAANSGQVLDFSALGVKVSLSGANAAGTAANIMTDLNGQTVVTAAGAGAALLQIGANDGQTMSVNIGNMHSGQIGAAGGYTSLDNAVSGWAAAAAAGGTTFTDAASNVLKSIDKALSDVSTTRGGLGALQNRLEFTINNLNVSSENLSASESRIRDLDMASEMVKFTRSQILQQAGTSILAQANQSTQGILSLLR